MNDEEINYNSKTTIIPSCFSKDELEINCLKTRCFNPWNVNTISGKKQNVIESVKFVQFMVKRDISNIKLPSLLLSDTFSVNTWTMISLGLMVYQDIIQTDCWCIKFPFS